MSETPSAGLFSSLRWGGAELLIHTEIGHPPDPKVTTLLTADGEVLSRAEGEWPSRSGGQFQEQRRLKGYHERMLKAMRRLRDEKKAGLRELGSLFSRLSAVALKLGASPAAEALWAAPGARWVALLAAGGQATDSAPDEGSGAGWHAPSGAFLKLARDLSRVFDSGEVIDITLRTAEGTVFIIPVKTVTMIAEVDTGKAEVARQVLRRFASEVAK